MPLKEEDVKICHERAKNFRCGSHLLLWLVRYPQHSCGEGLWWGAPFVMPLEAELPHDLRIAFGDFLTFCACPTGAVAGEPECDLVDRVARWRCADLYLVPGTPVLT